MRPDFKYLLDLAHNTALVYPADRCAKQGLSRIMGGPWTAIMWMVACWISQRESDDSRGFTSRFIRGGEGEITMKVGFGGGFFLPGAPSACTPNEYQEEVVFSSEREYREWCRPLLDELPVIYKMVGTEEFDSILEATTLCEHLVMLTFGGEGSMDRRREKEIILCGDDEVMFNENGWGPKPWTAKGGER